MFVRLGIRVKLASYKPVSAKSDYDADSINSYGDVFICPSFPQHYQTNAIFLSYRFKDQHHSFFASLKFIGVTFGHSTTLNFFS